MFTHRLTRTVAVTLALGAVAAPAATAMPIDPPTQNIRGADAQGAPTGPKQNLRGADAQGAPTGPKQNLRGADAQGAPSANDAYPGRGIFYPTPAEVTQDLRHADTRDFAEGRGTHNAPDVVVVKSPAEPVASSDFDWEGVGIGAGGMLSLALIGAGGVLVVARRRSVRLAG